MKKYHIEAPARQICFLSQLSHESCGLFLTEELSSGHVYEGRKELGNIYPGDGVRFKGRGLIQIVGRGNYEELSEALEEDFISHPSLLGAKNVNECSDEQLRYSALSAGWLWDRARLNKIADKIDLLQPIVEGDNLEHFKEITWRITGGLYCIEDRLQRFVEGFYFIQQLN